MALKNIAVQVRFPWIAIFLIFHLKMAMSFKTSDSIMKHVVEKSLFEKPEVVVEMAERSMNGSRSRVSYLPCGTGNPIDDCWRCDPNWVNNRKRLADCAIGFGNNAIGGQNGRFYVVTDPNDDDPVNPRPNNPSNKEVTKQEDTPDSVWRNWNWRSQGDLMLNGAFFTPSGAGASSTYARTASMGERPSSIVGSITATAGVLTCKKGSSC